MTVAVWKPTAAEKRAIRAYARSAAYIRAEIDSATVMVAEWITPGGANRRTLNKLLAGKASDAEVYDVREVGALRDGVELTEAGEAVVVVYSFAPGQQAPDNLLATNRARVAMIGDAPALVGMESTSAPPAERRVLEALICDPGQRTDEDIAWLEAWGRRGF
ncbi:hypothetical protein D516_3613 [Rhodobacter sp. AKP1]|nr:hypothetical protein D516_3613 [Rhodobacter sp. AKP1]